MVRVHIDKTAYKQKPQGTEIAKINNRIAESTDDLTIGEILDELSNGHTILPSEMKNKQRKKVNFKQQQLILLDFDNDDPANYTSIPDILEMEFTKENAAFIYKSFSHTDDHHRFRLGFVLDKPLTDPEDIKRAFNYLLSIYPPTDNSCLEPARLFFGGKEGYEIDFDNVLSTSIIAKTAEIATSKPSTKSKKSSNKVKNKKAESLNDAFTQARQVDMVEFLYDNGYEVAPVGQAFSCIFDEHEDGDPSAIIYQNDRDEYRYFCHSHFGGDDKLNLSLIDLWSELSDLSIEDSITEVLAYIGVEYKESDFVRKQKEKYHYNTSVIGDLEYIKTNFPDLHTYLNKYELEIRALMDYAEANLYGDKYSHNNDAIFSISKRHITKTFVNYKKTSTIDYKRDNNVVKLFCLLGIMSRIPYTEIPKYAKAKTQHLTVENREINFYKFNNLTDRLLSKADHKAKKLKNSGFRIKSFSKDFIITVFGQDIADTVYPDKRGQSEVYNYYKTQFTKKIMSLLDKNGYTTRKEVLQKIRIKKSKETKKTQFDKVIKDICESYDLSYVTATKDIRCRYNINAKSRTKVIIPNN